MAQVFTIADGIEFGDNDQTIVDEFAYADGTVLNGNNWDNGTAGSGMEVASGLAKISGSGSGVDYAFHKADLGINAYAFVTLNTAPTNTGDKVTGLILKSNFTNNYGYYFYYMLSVSGTSFYLGIVNGGGINGLGDTTRTDIVLQDGDVIGLDYVDGWLRAYLNWTLISEVYDDTFISDYLGAGLYSSDTSVRFDDFTSGTSMSSITTIDLVNSTGPYYLASWEPGVNQWKDGGVFSSNSFSDGRSPISRNIDTVQEKLTIHISGIDQNDVINNLRKLTLILENAIKYFSDKNGRPAFMSVKADNESEVRYGLIVGYKLEVLPGQFNGPFITGGTGTGVAIPSLYSNVELIIERREWLRQSPGKTTRSKISSQSVYNSITLGSESSAVNNAFVALKYTTSNLTHIFYYNSSTNTYGGNLLIASLPYSLLPAADSGSDGVNDILYFGCDTSLTNSGPFNNVVFDISVVSTLTGAWEYWNGAWVSLTTQNNTKNNGGAGGKGFDTLGSNVVSFAPPSDWTTTTVGVTGYFIRYTISAVGTEIRPVQANRHPYSATVPYFEMDPNQVKGDLEALSRVIVTNQSASSSTYFQTNSLLIGRRAVKRGIDFNAYINLGDEQRPGGVSVSTSGSYSTNVLIPTGRTLGLTHTDSSLWDDEFTISINGGTASAYANQYYGRFRVFLVAYKPTGTKSTKIKLASSSGNITGGTNKIGILPVYDNCLQTIDLGFITLPPGSGQVQTDLHHTIGLTVESYYDEAVTIYYSHLILLPVDESVIQVTKGSDDLGRGSTSSIAPNWLYIDNASNIGINAQASLRYLANDFGAIKEFVNGSWSHIGGSGLYLSKDRSRYWCVGIGSNITNSLVSHATLELNVSRLDRYLLPIGNN